MVAYRALWLGDFLSLTAHQTLAASPCAWDAWARLRGSHRLPLTAETSQAGTSTGCLLTDLGGLRAGGQGEQAPSGPLPNHPLHSTSEQKYQLASGKCILAQWSLPEKHGFLGRAETRTDSYPVGSGGQKVLCWDYFPPFLVIECLCSCVVNDLSLPPEN